MSKILEAKGLQKSFGQQKVINDISLEISEGEFVSLIGESGSGKSTLLYLLSGIEKPDSGNVIIDGHDITTASEKEMAKLRSECFSFVFQFDNLLPNLTIFENVMLPLVIANKASDDERQRAKELLDYIGLAHVMDKRPSEVSGGEQQRASIARALIIQPKIIFLDEPTGSLDSDNNKQIMDLLLRLNAEKGTTMLQVTHSLHNAQLTGRIVTIRDGVLLDA